MLDSVHDRSLADYALEKDNVCPEDAVSIPIKLVKTTSFALEFSPSEQLPTAELAF